MLSELGITFISTALLISLALIYFSFIEVKNSNNISDNLILSFSYLLLNRKNFDKGFNYFDARLKLDQFSKKNKYHFNIIKKLDENINLRNGKSSLIIKEQGVGDEILFSSMYNDLLKNNFSKIQIECDKRLLEIFKRSFNKNIFVPFGHYSSSAKDIQDFDNVIYAGSLTKYFRKTESDFNNKPYIKSLDKLDEEFTETELNNLKLVTGIPKLSKLTTTISI